MIAKETESKSKKKRVKVQKEAEVVEVKEPSGKRPGRPLRSPSVTT